MPCKDAMIAEEIIVGRSDQTVAEIIEIFDDNGIRAVPIVDENQKLLGMFSFSDLLHELLPLSATIDEEDHPRYKHLCVNLGYLQHTAPLVANKLSQTVVKQVLDVIPSDVHKVFPETPLREAMRLIVMHGSPLAVVDNENDMKLVGLVSAQSILRVLKNMSKEIDRDAEKTADHGA